MAARLEIERLSVRLGQQLILDAVSFSLLPGRIVAAVGASGSGKTTLLRALAGLLPPGASASGRIAFEGRELSLQPGAANQRTWRGLRGWRLACIPQEPQAALDPRRSVRAHLRECGGGPELLTEVGLDPKRASDYPFQWSGGMQQRLLIALALARRPAVLLGDEPSAALDSWHQAQIQTLLRSLCQARQLAAFVATHDLAFAAALADEVLVLAGGRIVETGPPRQVFSFPAHPATARLVAAQLPWSYAGVRA